MRFRGVAIRRWRYRLHSRLADVSFRDRLRSGTRHVLVRNPSYERARRSTILVIVFVISIEAVQ